MHSAFPSRLLRWLAAVALALFVPVLAEGGTVVRLAVDNDGAGGQPSMNWRGDVATPSYVGWVELKSVNFGFVKERTSPPNQAPTFGSPVFTGTGFLKLVDRISPRIFQQVALSNSPIAKVEIHYISTAPTERTFLKIRLENVHFGNVSSAATGGAEVSEAVELFFTKMTMTYVPVSGADIVASYNLLTQAP